MLPFVILLAITAGLAQSSGASSIASANAIASGDISIATANAFTTGNSAIATASSYASSTNNGNGVPRDCTYDKCTPTCSLRSPKNCSYTSNPCDCPSGYIISDRGGKCVPQQDCDQYINCKGDYNSTYSDCPIGCPSTCAKPNAQFCDTKCSLGCVCKPGYILDKPNGKCIKVEDCPAGTGCVNNDTYVYCAAGCPTNYCPTDDSLFQVACSPPQPCPSGCSCKANYKRKSTTETQCILASECPPVKCTRPNEVWNSCPKPCYSDRCSDRNTVTKPEDCPPYKSYCDPKCVCQPGFYRNGTNICVPPQECPN